MMSPLWRCGAARIAAAYYDHENRIILAVPGPWGLAGGNVNLRSGRRAQG